MTVTAADEEGRAAVGGNLTFTGTYNYQVGSGDYAYSTPLKDTDEYSGCTNFAHAIVGGYYGRINTLSYDGNNWRYVNEDEDLYKRFVVSSESNYDNSYHWLNSSDQPYGTDCYCSNYVHANEEAQFYEATLIDFDEVFELLEQRSTIVANKEATGTTSISTDGTIINFDGTGCEEGSIIYFTVESLTGVKQINYINIPDGCYMIVNVTTSGSEKILECTSEGGTLVTTLNDTVISNQGSVYTNNNENSSYILYNYSNATDIYIATNFNGTIFAPYANVTSSETCQGHLSGAIVALSFYGGEEIGYRPFKGSVEILGTQSGYAVPVAKIDENSDYVEGATITMYDESENYVTSFKSSDSKEYMEVPTGLDFDGSTEYTSGSVVTTKYTLQETATPDGYLITDDYYTIELVETVNAADTNGIPMDVTVVMTIKDSDDDTIDTYNFEYKDGYDTDNNHISREITITFADTSTVTFTLTINTDGDVTRVKAGSDEISISDLTESCTFEYDNKTYYYDPSSYMIMLMDSSSVETLEFVNSTGLQFQKVDEDGKLLSGATIALEVGELSASSGSYYVDSTVIADVLSSGSKITLVLSDLDSATVATNGRRAANVYCLTETAAPDGYEVASDIYFVIYNNTLYWISTDSIDDITSTFSISNNQGGRGNQSNQGQQQQTLSFTGWNSISLDELADSGSVIQMTDILIDGAKVELQKIDEATGDIISSGATLVIYNKNDEIVATVTNGDTTLSDYLEPGVYYIVETIVPEGYDDSLLNEPIYFTVNDDHTVTAGKSIYAEFTASSRSFTWGL
ncbi:MAG: choice-of-anchor A family protein [Ruminococcus sp.]|nr:choice-of-anchor A family protein [Ruminococcus sp.]